ncbi:hypothetical protein AB1K09_16070 [Solibacillus silvestris]
MIDTFEIRLTTAQSVVDLLSRELDQKIKFRNSSFYKLSNPLRRPGVRAINITRQKNSEKYSIAIEINPTELLKDAPSIELFHCSKENVEALKQVLNEVLESIHPYLSITNRKWHLSRIDYAMQFYTPHVELYTVLESKGPIPYRYESLQKPGSTYKKCKSSRINAYNKGQQISKTNNPAFLKEKANELYRFEYQCKNPKYLLKKYNTEQNEWFGLFREEIALAVLRSQHERHIKAGDYYTYSEAAKRIKRMEGKHHRTKNQAIEVLKFIEAAGSIPSALQAIQNDAEGTPEGFKRTTSQQSFEKLKDKFNEFIRDHLCKEGINPVLLPCESGIILLPNTSSRLFTI